MSNVPYAFVEWLEKSDYPTERKSVLIQAVRRELSLGPSKFRLGHSLDDVLAAGLAALGPAPLDPETQRKFDQYCKLLEQKGFFEGLVAGTPQYQERVEMAKKKFLERVAERQPQQSEAERVQEADNHKIAGNQALAQQQYGQAVDAYTKAIDLNPNNAIYFANRAAAFTHLERYSEAISDCKEAIRLDPAYSKGYSRLGTAYFNLERYSEAVEQYHKAVELEPSNAALQESLRLAQSKLGAPAPSPAPTPASAPAPADDSEPAGIPAGLPPGLAGLMNNPVMQNLAQEVMQNSPGGVPNIASVMNNPNLMNMMQNVMSDPNTMGMLQGLMQNPGLADMMRQFGGGQ